ncbi:MAG: DUF6055 domain-containing protein [Cytophagaceae bacterium]
MNKLLLTLLLTGIFFQLSAQKTVFRPTEFDNPANEFYNNVSDTRKYESANFVLYWGDLVGTNPAVYPTTDLRFNPQSVADTLEKIFTRYITDLHFINNSPTTNFGKYKIIIMMMNTWTSTDPRLTGFAAASSFSNTIGAMFVHPSATRDGGALSHEFAHTLQMMMRIQENPGAGRAYAGYDWAGPFFEGHANYMRAMAYPQWADTDGTLTRWLQTRHFMWSSNRHHYTNYHLLFYVQEKEGFDFTRRMWAESQNSEHPLETIKRLKGFTQEQLNDYLWGYAQRQPAFDYPIIWTDQITATNNFGTKIRQVHQTIKNNMPRYVSRQFTLLTKVAGTTDQFYTNDDWAPQDYGMNIIPLYPTCTEAQKKVTIKFKGHTEVNTTQAGWRYGFVTTKADGTISRYSPMYNGDGEASFTLNSATEANIYLVVYSAPKAHVSYNMDVGYPKQRRYPYELKIANAVPEGFQTAANFRSFLKTNGHIHANGGGWVSNNANVAASVYVGPYTIVRGGTVSGNVRIEDYATVEGGNISGSAIIRGNAYVYNATISDNAIVEGNGWMEGGSVTNTAVLKGNAMCWAASYSGTVVVGGDAEVGSCSNGVYLQTPYWRNGRDNCDGKGATDASNVDINATFTNFTAAQMAFSATPTCTDIVTYALSTTIVGQGTVSPSSGTFNSGTVQTLTATAATGYTFTGWSGDATGTTNPLSVTMTANKNITATFTINKYNLTTTVVGSGTVSPASGQFNYNTVQTLTATAAPGYTFTGWSGDATGTTNPLSVTMTANKNITATFTINKYNLTTTVVGSGTVSPASGQFNYNTVQTLTATAAPGYTFTGWSGDATGTTNPLSVTMTANKNITATFTINKYNFTTSVVGSGTVSPASGQFNYNTVQTLTATAAPGYTFTGWSGDATGTTNPMSVTITANKNITATFTINTYNLTTTVVGSGTVSPSSGQFYYNTIQTLTATAAPGYTFTGWSGDATGSTNPLSVTMTANMAITATFTAVSTAIQNPTSKNTGIITPNPSSQSFTIDLTDESDVDVYSVDGKHVLHLHQVESAVFGEELAPGLYIVQAGNNYFKIIKE